MGKKAKTLDPIQERERKVLDDLLENRKARFIELLGEDCEFIPALVIREDIHATDVKALLDRGCPIDKIPEILF